MNRDELQALRHRLAAAYGRRQGNKRQLRNYRAAVDTLDHVLGDQPWEGDWELPKEGEGEERKPPKSARKLKKEPQSPPPETAEE